MKRRMRRERACPNCGLGAKGRGRCPNCGASRRRRLGAAGWPTRAATWIVLLFVGLGLLIGLSWAFGGTTVSGGFEEEPTVGVGTLDLIALGTSRGEVEKRVGKGRGALDFYDEGVATEPMDATCVYYFGNISAERARIVQLCYRDGRLVRKQRY